MLPVGGVLSVKVALVVFKQQHLRTDTHDIAAVVYYLVNMATGTTTDVHPRVRTAYSLYPQTLHS